MEKSFQCENCKRLVKSEAIGTHHRNHCPYCLHSLHVDNRPGDRKSGCGGRMVPVGKIIREDGEELIVHKCILCGTVKKNRIAGDDSYKMISGLQKMNSRYN